MVEHATVYQATNNLQQSPKEHGISMTFLVLTGQIHRLHVRQGGIAKSAQAVSHEESKLIAEDSINLLPSTSGYSSIAGFQPNGPHLLQSWAGSPHSFSMLFMESTDLVPIDTAVHINLHIPLHKVTTQCSENHLKRVEPSSMKIIHNELSSCNSHKWKSTCPTTLLKDKGLQDP